MSPIQKKARNLLLQIKSLQECEANNTIGAFNLLNEVLRDAESLAKNHAETPIEISKRLKVELIGLSERSKSAMERSRKALENAQRLINNQM